MKFDLIDLKAFLAVADLRSFRAASEALCLSQSALSRRIDKLETALSVRLFERTTRKVELTTIGRGFVPRARNVLNELENALIGMEDVSDRLSGEVTIACVPSAVAYFLPAVIQQYHKRYPRIRVRVLDEPSTSLLATVANGDVDFALTYLGVQDADVEFHPLLEEPFVVAVPRAHRLAGRPRLDWADLNEQDYISLAQGSGNRFLIDQALAHTTSQPRWIYEVQHVSALVSFVAAGLGLGVVPQLAMPPKNDGSLVSIPLHNPPISRTIGLMQRRGRELRPVAQLLFDMLSEKRNQ
ncbi:LysR family transcriptional regulator [Advenella kashmirensis W13003]|uniref:LysR family transcriptional regulator n=1 Tax=Advenella kashmirensis W13003 TaxID=1424334 RepID=V8QVQ5_9BURK|nr:LysR family transcriptional regulator [Advenella kashmirensis]ETF03727.1 LysR family transcriptional regulator [Advenella kashmirensis W13003]